MKSFLYRISDVRRGRGNGVTTYQCELWQIKRNRVHFIGKREHTFESEFQAAMNTMQQFKVLPANTFRPNQFGGHHHNAPSLEAEGIAVVRSI